VVVTVSMSEPASERTSIVVVLAGTHCSTGIHSIVVDRRTVTSRISGTGGASAWRHLGHVVLMASQRSMHAVWKKCAHGSRSTCRW
jgi:hypothetical protein